MCTPLPNQTSLRFLFVAFAWFLQTFPNRPYASDCITGKLLSSGHLWLNYSCLDPSIFQVTLTLIIKSIQSCWSPQLLYLTGDINLDTEWDSLLPGWVLHLIHFKMSSFVRNSTSLNCVYVLHRCFLMKSTKSDISVEGAQKDIHM